MNSSGLSPSVPADSLQAAGTSGPLLLAALITWGLQGIMTVQICNYYIAFPNDVCWRKIVAYSIVLIELAQTILVTRDTFGTFAAGFGDVSGPPAVRLWWFNVPIVGGIIGLISKLTYCYRITILCQSRVAAAVVATMALASQSAAVSAGILLRQHGTLLNVTDKRISIATAIWLTGSAASDLVITVFMLYFLPRRETGFRRTHLLVNKILRATIETNALTATVATVAAVLFLHFPNHDYHATASASLAKLYANTLLIIFNDRMQIVGARNVIGDTEGPQMVSFAEQEQPSDPVDANLKSVLDISGNESQQRHVIQLGAVETTQKEDTRTSLQCFNSHSSSRKVTSVV